MSGVILILLLIAGIPAALTVLNVLDFASLFGARIPRLVSRLRADVITVFAGTTLTVLDWLQLEMPEHDEPITTYCGIVNAPHAPLAEAHLLSFGVFFGLGIGAYLLLRRYGHHAPPLVGAAATACLLVAMALDLVLLVQLAPALVMSALDPEKAFTVGMLLVFPANFLLISTTLLLRLHRSYREEARSTDQDNIAAPVRFERLRRLILASQRWPQAGILFALPFLTIAIAILTLFGQAPDAIVRVFTDTSDWTFSTLIPPPPIDEGCGHYLCTAAARGHRRLVRPLRLGVRRGRPILVNRQLLIANAFEQLVEERWPRVHRFLRQAYDRYGYPLSRKMTSAWRCDVIYVAMKPVELFFLLALYACARDPETRIARQYLPRNSVL
ncbi:MAG: hypothetical protein IPK13_10815 [Deltaproteobacteria bacterium]|nr:hypothetical protein [Deltaproteobacteria bacterium]